MIRSKYFKNYLNFLRAEGIKNEATYEFIGDLQIPLPNLLEQAAILSRYNEKIAEAERLEQDINFITLIDNILLKAFGVNKPQPKVRKRGLYFIKLSELTRWDALSSKFIYTDALFNSDLSLIALGNVANFISRSWNKRKHTEETFKYIGLGNVEPEHGIKGAKEIKVIKSPSRANQSVCKGDLIIGTTRPYLKRFSIIKQEFDGFVCSSGFAIIEETEHTNLSYIKYFLMSSFGEEQLVNNMSGALYPAITLPNLKNEIFIPKLAIELQNTVVQELDTLVAERKAKQAKAKQLRQQAQQEFEQTVFLSSH